MYLYDLSVFNIPQTSTRLIERMSKSLRNKTRFSKRLKSQISAQKKINKGEYTFEEILLSKNYTKIFPKTHIHNHSDTFICKLERRKRSSATIVG